MAEWSPQLAFADDDVAIGHVGPIVAHFWYRHVTVAAIQKLEGVIAERAVEGPLAVLTVVQPTATVPDQPARAMTTAYLEAVAEHLAVSALVVEGPAMQSAAFRGLHAGYTMLAGRGYPSDVFDSVSGAAAWIVEHAPAHWGLGAERFESLIDELRGLPR